MAGFLQTIKNGFSGSNSNKVIVENADSDGFILDYMGYSPNTGKSPFPGYSPKFDPAKSLKLIRNDPVVRAAIITLVDKVVESGWRLKASDGRSKQKQLEEKLRELRFDRLLRKVIFNLIMYNNAFVEITDSKDLNILETDFMRINAKDNGDIINYYQEARGGGKQNVPPTWTPEEVVHFKLDDFTTSVWSEVNVESIYETVLIKDYVRQWLMWFFKTNQLRPVISIENGTGSRVKEFMAYLKAAEQHVDKPIPLEGKAVVQKLQSFADEGASILELLQWCDQQILMLLQAPPLSVGLTDVSGRSDGAEQKNYLNTRVLAIQRLLEDDITYDLFDKMDFGKMKFRFGVLDETVRTRVFETVQMMRNSQFTPEAIEEYLEAQGVVFDTDKPLMSQEDIMQLSNKDLGTGNEGMKGNQSADAAQSRQRQNDEDISDANTQGQAK